MWFSKPKSVIARLFERFQTYKPVEIRAEDFTRLAEAVLRDYSSKGALVFSGHWECCERRLIVWFPEHDVGKAGTVKWNIGHHIGIEFDDESELPFLKPRQNDRRDIVDSIYRDSTRKGDFTA